MSLYSAAQMGQQLASQQPGGVATGHVPQQPNLGLGPNRYVPPTFNWGRGGLDGRQPQYNQMDWNQMQAYYMPQHQNSPFTGGYMGQLQQMLGMFSNQYGGPNRQPTLPQFSSYNPGFGGPTSFFDQMRGGGVGGGGRGSDPYAAYLEYQQNNPNGTDPGFNIGGPGQRAATLSREQYSQWLRDTASGMYDNMYPDPYGRGGGDLIGGFGDRMPGDGEFMDIFDTPMRGGGMQNPEGYSDRWSLAPSEMRGGNGGFRGGFGGRGGYPQMPQFNPYMLARNNMMGMDFNQMFDPRYAMLFGMGGLGAMTPNGPQQPSGLKPGQLGGGG